MSLIRTALVRRLGRAEAAMEAAWVIHRRDIHNVETQHLYVIQLRRCQRLQSALMFSRSRVFNREGVTA